jgi:hypothetical protein
VPLWRGKAELEAVAPLERQRAYDINNALRGDDDDDDDANATSDSASVAAATAQAALVWRVAYTGEEFRNYDEYARRVAQYAQRQWHCALTGKKGLTYRDALRCEQEARRSVALFAATHRDDVLRHVHLQTVPVSDLCAQLRARYTDLYFAGESVLVKTAKRTTPLKARIVDRLPLAAPLADAAVRDFQLRHAKRHAMLGTAGSAGGSDDKVRDVGAPSAESQRFEYRVELLAASLDERLITVPFDSILRKPHPTPHNRLRDFIRSACLRSSRPHAPWIVPDDEARRLGLPLAPRDELDRLERERTSAVITIEQLDHDAVAAAAAADAPSAASGAAGAASGAVPSGAGASKRGKKPFESKYPIADAELTAAERAGEGAYPKPAPLELVHKRRRGAAPTPFAGELLMVTEFVSAFDEELKLTPFDARQLAAALDQQQQTTLLDELHIQLLSALLAAEQISWASRTRDERDADEKAHLKLPAFPAPNDANWFSVVFAILEWRERRAPGTAAPELREALDRFRERGYFALAAPAKLVILGALVNELLASDMMRRHVNDAADVLDEARKEERRRLHPAAAKSGGAAEDVTVDLSTPAKTRGEAAALAAVVAATAAAADASKTKAKKKGGKAAPVEREPPTPAEVDAAMLRLRTMPLGRDRESRRVHFLPNSAPNKLLVEVGKHDAWLAQVRARAASRRVAGGSKRNADSAIDIDDAAAAAADDDENADGADNKKTSASVSAAAAAAAAADAAAAAADAAAQATKRSASQLSGSAAAAAAAPHADDFVPPSLESLADWYAYTTAPQVAALQAYLNPKGCLEAALKANIAKQRGAIDDELACDGDAPPSDDEIADADPNAYKNKHASKLQKQRYPPAPVPKAPKPAAVEVPRPMPEVLSGSLKDRLDRLQKERRVRGAAEPDALELKLAQAKCAECDGGRDQENICVCDGGCGRVFHTYCHKPNIGRVPRGKWLCRHCSGVPDSEPEEEEDEEDLICTICKKGDRASQLMLCDGNCNGAYHTFCLDPPLKKVPANDWYCKRCSSKSKSKSRAISTRRSSRKRNADDDDDEDEEDDDDDDEDDDEDDESVDNRSRKSKSAAKKKPSNRRRRADASLSEEPEARFTDEEEDDNEEEGEDEEDEEEESSVVVKPAKKKKKASAPASKKAKRPAAKSASKAKRKLRRRDDDDDDDDDDDETMSE